MHVDQHSIRGLPLATVAGHYVTAVRVRALTRVEADFMAGVHPDSKVAARADMFDSVEALARPSRA